MNTESKNETINSGKQKNPIARGTLEIKMTSNELLEETVCLRSVGQLNVHLGYVLKDVSARSPERATDGSAGYDISSCNEYEIQPYQRIACSTGVAVSVPFGYVGNLVGRSSMTLKGLDVMTGTIDSDYRGVVSVVLVNNSHNPYVVSIGQRIAQLVVTPCLTAPAVEYGELPATQRGEGGFGSTGR
jgi:dUTP pyrophosphatase